MNKKKTIFSRMSSGFLAAFIMAILFSLYTIPASAAGTESVSTPVSVTVSAATPVHIAAQPLLPSCEAAVMFPVAAAENGVINNSSGSATADAAYTNVVNFFLVWIRRVGALIALVGGIMFGLSVKNNDGDQKQSAVLTMVAGFIVFAIALGADMFDLFT